MEQLDIISMITREMKNKRISGAELAKVLQINHSSVSGMLDRRTLQVQRLAELSEFFRYNFFREIAQKFPFAEPDYSEIPAKSEVSGLQSRVRDLELEVSILRQTIKDLVSR